MTLSRKKMTAGVLGLGLCGLAAVAEGPAPAPALIPTLPTLAPAVPAPPPVAVPSVNEITSPTPVPPVPVAPEPKPIKAEPKPAAVPVIPAPIDVAPPTPALEPAPVPRVVKEEKIVDVPVQVGPGPVVIDTPAAVAPVVAMPAPKPVPVEVAPAPATVTPVAAVGTVEKKLRVVLAMGDERPRFEVRDGEEALLKVLCERVDVKSPSEKGEPMSLLKALGKVTFVTPGGEGTCDELSVVPGTGELVVSGAVKFRYHWGKVETEVVGERMTFRLGSPSMAVTSGPGMVVTPASLRR